MAVSSARNTDALGRIAQGSVSVATIAFYMEELSSELSEEESQSTSSIAAGGVKKSRRVTECVVMIPIP